MKILRLPVLLLLLCAIATAGIVACSDNNNNGGVLNPPAKELDSGNIATNGGTFAHQFKTIGTYNYKCTIHSGMTGQVICVAGAPASVAVTIGPGNTFNPPTASVDTSGTVTWTNISTVSPHTVTSN